MGLWAKKWFLQVDDTNLHVERLMHPHVMILPCLHFDVFGKCLLSLKSSLTMLVLCASLAWFIWGAKVSNAYFSIAKFLVTTYFIMLKMSNSVAFDRFSIISNKLP